MPISGARPTSSDDLRELARQLRDRVGIRQVLADCGHTLRRSGRSLVTLCPLHTEGRPSFHVRTSGTDGVERFYCFGCGAGRARTNFGAEPGAWGDVFDLVQMLEKHPDYVSTLRALAERYHIAWVSRGTDDLSLATRVLDAATAYYAHHLQGAVLTYLANRGFPEAFLKHHQVGYAPPEPAFGFARYAEAQQVDRAAEELGLIQRATATRPRRDHFLGRVIFPNLHSGHAIDLQGRAFPNREPRYLNLPSQDDRQYIRLPRRRPYHSVDASTHTHVLLCEGIPDTLSVLLAGLPACGIYGKNGWTREYQPLFRPCRRVYVPAHHDAIDRAIAIAKEFGLRGRVMLLPPELDVNEWLVGPAEADPGRFKELLLDAMAGSLTPWELAIARLPEVPARDRHGQLLPLLREITPLPRALRDALIEALADRTGLSAVGLCATIADLQDEEASPWPGDEHSADR